MKPPIKSLSRTLVQHVLLFMQRVHLDIQVGEHAVDYAHVAQKEKLSELQLRVRQLLDQTEQISKEQNYQRVIYYKSLNLLGSFNHGRDISRGIISRQKSGRIEIGMASPIF